jgi:hypothetical protein
MVILFPERWGKGVKRVICDIRSNYYSVVGGMI